jgi:hypothetical protein
MPAMSEQPMLRRSVTVAQQRKRERLRWYSAYLTILGAAVVLTALAIKMPGPFSIALSALVITAIAWVVRPIVGMHLTLFFTLFGDYVTIPWFPFTKDFSSRESVLYVSHQLKVTPLIVVVVIAVVAVLLRHFALHEQRLVFGPMFGPLSALTLFLAFGFLYGLSRGGDLRIALFESNGLFLLPFIYFLVSNTCHTPRDYRGLLWTALCAVVGQSTMSIVYYLGLSAARKKNLEALGEHGSAVTINAFLVVLIISFLFLGATRARRAVLLAGTLPVGFVYFISQRRSAFVGLGAAFVAMSVVLFWRHRKRFWRVLPAVGIVTVGYLGAFWNSTGQLAFPAQAAKTVINPSSVSLRDQSSDQYRHIENYDLNFTIRNSKLLGIGFGQEFLRPIPLPDISFFEFYLYIPHNSMLWIWLQAGFFGFVSMLFVLGRALALGARKARQLVDHEDFALVLSSALFVLMYAIFAFVDIAWSARDTMFLGFCFAVCANFPMTTGTLNGFKDLISTPGEIKPFRSLILARTDEQSWHTRETATFG